MPADIYIYAELLLNIRQVTAVASLPSECNSTTSVTLSKDRHTISIKHEGNSARMKLPATIRLGCIPRIAAGSSRALSFRLPIADEAASEILASSGCLQTNTIWPAYSITPETDLACRSCFAPLMKTPIKTWKNLPSENWAEMMDFWHCHKPDTDDSSTAHEQNGFHKGYGAGNSIAPTPGVGLVDTTYLFLMQRDCNVVLDTNPVMLKVPWQSVPSSSSM
ncbi:MAG: hypothetical protein L6R40_007043 [Gallowayella cf. fulva]|nr:MAG: hypothetical protein L6R40_007043 [Xanthomendoza cf. fulva]